MISTSPMEKNRLWFSLIAPILWIFPLHPHYLLICLSSCFLSSKHVNLRFCYVCFFQNINDKNLSDFGLANNSSFSLFAFEKGL
ncbi:hypothetical protein Nmel_008942 [Mimus melanotis]